ncbi:ABC transporter ATP-binding protein [Algihabitans albus]|uniref:ABC transporter ATP-binding protein n=1 Tax=Algihabitans albus TaxID=2164067 RepID=UPI000E5D9716|nr:ABC transporter ATP-binding protein [Algihabitans albus]
MAEPSRLSVRDVRLGYGRRGQPLVHAVDGVSFDLHAGETFGIVGESGCGKSSLAKSITGLNGPNAQVAGEVRLDGRRIDDQDARAWKVTRRRLQYVFQDPLGALDPRMPVLAQVREPLDVHRVGSARGRAERAARLLTDLGVGQKLHGYAPVELSGGQRQRVVLARALALAPDVLLCDEPVSALDVSIQAQILTLLGGLQKDFGLTLLFISHDLAVVRHVSRRVAVMYLGRFVEVGEIDAVFARPAHPYTRALIASAPSAADRLGRSGHRIRLDGETPSPAARPKGCAFAARCPVAQSLCRSHDPALTPLTPSSLTQGDGRAVACHFPYAPEAAA